MTHALVLAGGQGTRLRPLTDTRPKPLVPFCGEPFAAGLLRRLAAVGVRHVTFLVGRDTAPYAPLERIGEGLGIAVAISTEERPLDTAGAVRRALRGHDAGPVLVCNGDILTDLDLAELLRSHARTQAKATIALTRVADTSTFGVVVCDADGRIRRFVEKPPPGTVEADTVNAGTYVLDADVFDRFPGDGPLSFEREVFPGLLADGVTMAGHAAEAFWADLGTPARYLDATAAVLEGRCAWPLGQGMRLTADRALVHERAAVRDAVLGPGTVVGADCSVGEGAALVGSVLFDRARVGPRADLRRCILGEAAAVRPEARLDAAVLADGAAV